MRAFGPTFAVLFVAASSLLAQNPPAPPALKPEAVDQLLEKWQKRMRSLESFSAEVALTETHSLTKKTTSYLGKAAFKNPNLAFIDLTHKDEIGKNDAEKTNFKRYCCDGKFLYEFNPTQKQLVQHALPATGAADDNIVLAFLRGLQGEDIRKRFDVTATSPSEWYVYLDFKPKEAADKQDFDLARVALRIKNADADKSDQRLLPNLLWHQEPNGNVRDYRLAKIEPNARLDPAIFKPRLSEGYREVPANAPQSPPSQRQP